MMLKFSALSSETSSEPNADEDDLVRTREAQEAQALSLYRDALTDLATNNAIEGILKLKDLLKLDYVNEGEEPDKTGRAASGGPLSASRRLKYLTLKNIGEAYLRMEKLQKAAKYFILAMSIDERDVATWVKIGDIGLQLLNIQMARCAFEMAVRARGNHWGALDRLICVTYILGDYRHCVEWCRRSFRGKSNSPYPVVLADRIFEECPYLQEISPSAYRAFLDTLQSCEVTVEKSQAILEECERIQRERDDFLDWLSAKGKRHTALKLRKVVKELTWAELGEVLVVHYDTITKSGDPTHLLERISFNQDVEGVPSKFKRFHYDSSDVEDDKLSQGDDSTDLEGFGEDGPKMRQVGGFDYKRLDQEDSENSQPNELAMLIGDITPTDSLLDDLGLSSIDDSRSQRRKRLFQDFVVSSGGGGSITAKQRRSTRARNHSGKKSVDLSVNYRELLIPFLPTNLFAEHSSQVELESSEPDGQDEVHLQLELSAFNSRTYPENVIDIREHEAEEVSAFLNENKDHAALAIMTQYLIVLCQRSDRRWSPDLKTKFLAVYERVRHHRSFPDDRDEKHLFEVLRWAWVLLNACELFFERYVFDNLCGVEQQLIFSASFPLNEFIQAINFVCRQSFRRLAFGYRWQEFCARAFYLEARFYLHYGDFNMARHRLEQICFVMNRENFTLIQPVDDETEYDDTEVENSTASCEDSAKKQASNEQHSYRCQEEIGEVEASEKFFQIDDPIDVVHVVNLRSHNMISAQIATETIEGIERLRDLEQIDGLFASRNFEKVVSIIVETFNVDQRIQAKTTAPSRQRQLLILHEALMELGDFSDVMRWSEQSIHECLTQYVKASNQELRSAWSETTVSLIEGVWPLVDKRPEILHNLPDSLLSRFAHTLIKLISLQMDLRESAENMAIPTVLTWNLLYRIVKYGEEKAALDANTTTANSYSYNSGMPPSLMLIFTAHEYLGKRQWCMRDEGAFVLLCVRVLSDEVVNFRNAAAAAGTSCANHPFEEDLSAGLEQCFHCLYGLDRDSRPGQTIAGKRKSAFLAAGGGGIATTSAGHQQPQQQLLLLQDHGVTAPLKLTWEHAKYVYAFYAPTRLPEFDSYQLPSISSDAEVLFRRIASLIPAEINPATCADRMATFIENCSSSSCSSSGYNQMPQISADCPDRELIEDLYYLLGDFYFKNRDFVKASRYYLLDSCINPDRVDSWAGMGLSRSAQIDQRLNSCEFRGDGLQLLKRSDGAMFCFQKALELLPNSASLWIECGSCAYSVVSYLCRQIKMRKALQLSQTAISELNRKKVEYLNLAKKCYNEAIRCELEGTGNDELWLCHYMLSKVTHKMKEPLEVYMEHIFSSAQNLYELEARYPKKILYHNPPHLSIEALEMHYKIHAFALKYLIRNQTRRISLAELQVLDKYLRAASEGCFARHKERLKEISGTYDSVDTGGEDSDGGFRTVKRQPGRPRREVSKEKKSDDQVQSQAVRLIPQQQSTLCESLTMTVGSSDEKPDRLTEEDTDAVRCVINQLLSKVERTAALDKGDSTCSRFQDTSEYDGLLDALFAYCVDAFKECILRFSAHFKSVYHMANMYFRYKRVRNAPLALDYLMSKQSHPPQLCIQGLFAERRPSCLFQGVWHIPADEIDRPGSFATHLYRAARLVQLIASYLKDHDTLVQIGLMMAKTPDVEKKYIRDFDRSLVSKAAFNEGLNIVEEKFCLLLNEEPPPLEKVLISSLVDIYRVWQQCTKVNCYTREAENVLKKCYTLFKLGEVDSTPSVVEQASSFCSKYLIREARKEKLALQEAQKINKLKQEVAAKAAQEAARAAQQLAIKEQFEQQQALSEAMERAVVEGTSVNFFEASPTLKLGSTSGATTAAISPMKTASGTKQLPARALQSTGSIFVDSEVLDGNHRAARPDQAASPSVMNEIRPSFASSEPITTSPVGQTSKGLSPAKGTPPKAQSVNSHSSHFEAARTRVSPILPAATLELAPPMSPTVATSMGVMALVKANHKAEAEFHDITIEPLEALQNREVLATSIPKNITASCETSPLSNKRAAVSTVDPPTKRRAVEHRLPVSSTLNADIAYASTTHTMKLNEPVDTIILSDSDDENEVGISVSLKGPCRSSPPTLIAGSPQTPQIMKKEPTYVEKKVAALKISLPSSMANRSSAKTAVSAPAATNKADTYSGSPNSSSDSSNDDAASGPQNTSSGHLNSDDSGTNGSSSSSSDCVIIEGPDVSTATRPHVPPGITLPKGLTLTIRLPPAPATSNAQAPGGSNSSSGSCNNKH